MVKKLLPVLLALSFFEIKAQTYYENIAQIFINRCGNCHNQYGVTPLLTYTQAKNNSANMLAYLQSGYMPPWPPDTTYTRFIHERLISSSEKNAIINWINGGNLYLDTTQAPTPPAYTRYRLNGVPSLELQIPTFASNATNADKYNCFSLPTGLTQDVYLRAFEIVAGTPSIVHHVVVNIDTTGTVTSDLSGGCYTQPGQFSIGGFAPGEDPLVFSGLAPLKLGMRIKAGSNVIMQIHYPKGSAGILDSTKIRMYFYPAGTTGIRPLIAKTLLQNWSFGVAANSTATVTAQYPSNSSTLSAPLSVYSCFPHSHKICVKITNWADSTGGTKTIPLVRVNKWDFDFQNYYIYRNLVKVPAGFKFRASHVFDNTTNNPNNPNPVLVTAGTSTGDEMLFDAFMYTNYQAGDEYINIDSLLQGDSLLTVGIPSYSHALNAKVGAYPNPFSDKVNIVYELTRPAWVTVAVYNVFGQEVGKLYSGYQTPGVVRHEWDARGIAPGAYIYKVMIDDAMHTGKIILKGKN